MADTNTSSYFLGLLILDMVVGHEEYIDWKQCTYVCESIAYVINISCLCNKKSTACVIKI